jgi:hypothetical protein
MDTIARPATSRLAALEERPGFLLAYVVLLSARCGAQLEGVDPRSKALPVRELREDGIDDEILLWLLYQGHVEHFRCSGTASPAESTLEPVDSVFILGNSCFALTEAGDRFGSSLLGLLVEEQEETHEAAWGMLAVGQLLPRYDRTFRRFTWGQHLLKFFRQPAINQEIVLCTAEELGWTAWFDDPLPRTPGTNPKERVHDTINALNRNQKPYLVHFKGDGSGARFGWEMR